MVVAAAMVLDSSLSTSIKLQEACRLQRHSWPVFYLRRSDFFWIINAAKTSGFVGFAIGRTVWEKSLLKVERGQLSPQEASEEIAKNFKSFCDLWLQVRHGKEESANALAG
jgi:hypothetical protein